MKRIPDIAVSALAALVLSLAVPDPGAFAEDVRSAPPVRTLTITDTVRVALMDNKSIQRQEEEVHYAGANVLYARSLFMPQITTGFGYTHYDAVLGGPDDPKERKDPRIFTGYKDQNGFEVVAQESIFNGGANYANMKQAKLGLRAEEETLRAAKLEIEFEAKRLFYGLLLAYETKRIARDLVGQAQAHYDQTRQMYAQGTASKFDVLQSKVQVARLIPQLVNADNAIDLIKAEFKQLLYLSMKDDIEAAGKLKFREIEIEEDGFLKEAYSRNPQMIIKLLGIDINKWGVEFAKAGWLPQVSASAGYNAKSNDIGRMINQRHDNWNVGIRASISLFDGFATKAKVDEAKARYNQSYLAKEDFVEQLAVDVKNACLNLNEARAIVVAERESIVDAREALRLSEVRFNNGVGINLDVLDSQVALAQVEQSLAEGMYDYTMAKAGLDKAMGREFSKEAGYYEDSL